MLIRSRRDMKVQFFFSYIHIYILELSFRLWNDFQYSSIFLLTREQLTIPMRYKIKYLRFLYVKKVNIVTYWRIPRNISYHAFSHSFFLYFEHKHNTSANKLCSPELMTTKKLIKNQFNILQNVWQYTIKIRVEVG